MILQELSHGNFRFHLEYKIFLINFKETKFLC